MKDANGDGTMDIAKGDKMGVTCALCHPITTGLPSACPMGGSAGWRQDGCTNHTLNVGRVLAARANSRALYPVFQLTLKANEGKTFAGHPRDSRPPRARPRWTPIFPIRSSIRSECSTTPSMATAIRCRSRGYSARIWRRPSAAGESRQARGLQEPGIHHPLRPDWGSSRRVSRWLWATPVCPRPGRPMVPPPPWGWGRPSCGLPRTCGPSWPGFLRTRSKWLVGTSAGKARAAARASSSPYAKPARARWSVRASSTPRSPAPGWPCARSERCSSKSASIRSWDFFGCGARLGATASAGSSIRETAKAQLTGGLTWGWGMAAMEQSQHEPVLGRFLSKNLAGVAIPVNADIPGDITVHSVDEVDQHASPIGGKGIGELGATGWAAAVANAVFHATGKRIWELPITPDKLVHELPQR